MAQMLSLKIDVSKIDKNRLYNGQKGVYLDAVVFLKDEPDQYGNIGMITQSVSKEEREAGTKGNILGNARQIGGNNYAAPPKNSTSGYGTANPPIDDLPWDKGGPAPF